jgi:small-conductance mechanosensitive channel
MILPSILAGPRVHALLVACGAVVAAVVIDWIFRVVMHRLAGRTKTQVDDAIVDAVRRPLAVTVMLLGLWASFQALALPDSVIFVTRGVLMSVAVLYWAIVVARVVSLVLDALARSERSVVNVRTRPIYSLAGRVLIIGAAAYFLLLAWDVDVTAWLASAGIIGIAVGFAAQQSLANLFAGVSILTDAPYKIGDFLALENGMRGRVTQIGFRSTRILTRDDVEVIIPNAQLASAVIVNESGGPYEKSRVRVPVSVAYGTDLEEARAILLDVASTASDEIVLDNPANAPLVRFVKLGESGLELELRVWIFLPEARGRVVDALNTQIYNRLRAAKIEIPYPKRDLYLHTATAGD